MNQVIEQIISSIDILIDTKLEKMKAEIIQEINKGQSTQMNDQLSEQLITLERQINNKFTQHDNILNLLMENQTNMKLQLATTTKPQMIRQQTYSHDFQINTEPDVYLPCGVCRKQVMNGGIQVNCGHEYHLECIQKKVTQQMETLGFSNGVCIAKTIDNKLCYGRIRVQDCHFALKQQQSLNKHQLNNQLHKLAIKLSICPFVNCDYYFMIDPTLSSVCVCPTCRYRYCLKCVKRVEGEHECQEQLQLLMRGKVCPKCDQFQENSKLSLQQECQNCKNVFMI